MAFTLRPYQSNCVNSAIEHIKKSLDSQVLVLPTAAGKSLCISEIAKIYYELSGKNVLCLAPNALLVKQNFEKYKSYGLPASIFCASLGVKSVRNNVVFASPLSVNNSLERFKNFGLVICDEGHLITQSVKSIIDHLSEQHEKLRVIAITATPYRTGTGYIYASHYRHGFIEETVNPYFKHCTYEISARYLLENNYISRPVVGKTQLHYETEKLELDKKGIYTQESIIETFEGKGRLTSDIIADIVKTTAPFGMGTLIFCSTIAHCYEALESLPPDISAVVTGETPDRKKKEKYFADGKIKYLVSVATQTTGCDYPIAFCCALLRKTESVILLQQMIGRILRLHEQKPFALILDYADNINTHFPDGDIFNPKVRAKTQNEIEKLTAFCPECNHPNSFAIRPNDAGYDLHENGYFTWPDTGDIVLDAEQRPVPSHFGRRCFGIVKRTDRCTYRWTFKLCEKCQHENDIAARFCESCKSEIIDPNEALAMEQAEAQRLRDERILAEPVLKIELGEQLARSGTKLKTVDITTLFNKRVRLFLRMAREDERNQWRKCRDMTGDAVVLFNRPQGSKFYKFIDLKPQDN